MCILSGFSQTNERKPIGTLTVYRAKRTFTAKYYAGGSKRFSQMDHHYKKDEWVTTNYIQRTINFTNSCLVILEMVWSSAAKMGE